MSEDETNIENFNLDSRQLARIEAVHRGFLYQHLYAAACLFQAASAGVTHVVVENDEDVELVLPDKRIYAQIKTRSSPPHFQRHRRRSLAVRCDPDRTCGGSQERHGRVRGRFEQAPGPELSERLRRRGLASDVALLWPGIRPRQKTVAARSRASARRASKPAGRRRKRFAFFDLGSETLVWKLAGRIMAAAAGVETKRQSQFVVAGPSSALRAVGHPAAGLPGAAALVPASGQGASARHERASRAAGHRLLRRRKDLMGLSDRPAYERSGSHTTTSPTFRAGSWRARSPGTRGPPVRVQQRKTRRDPVAGRHRNGDPLRDRPSPCREQTHGDVGAGQRASRIRPATGFADPSIAAPSFVLLAQTERAVARIEATLGVHGGAACSAGPTKQPPSRRVVARMSRRLFGVMSDC